MMELIEQNQKQLDKNISGFVKCVEWSTQHVKKSNYLQQRVWIRSQNRADQQTYVNSKNYMHRWADERRAVVVLDNPVVKKPVSGPNLIELTCSFEPLSLVTGSCQQPRLTAVTPAVHCKPLATFCAAPLPWPSCSLSLNSLPSLPSYQS